MESINLITIKKEVWVEASQETAFHVFTEQIDLWWPRTHHVGSCPMRHVVIEAKPGGRWYTLHEDGSEVNIGYVMVYLPYDQIALAWQINADFKCDPELLTEVTVQFIPDGPTSTKVILTHKDLDKLGSGNKTAESMEMGWGMIMNLYKKQAEQ